MPRERVAALEELVKTNPYWDKLDPPELQLRHDMMRAKLAGFLERPDSIARRYPQTDTSLPARYARAIAAHRFGGIASATAQIDALIQAQPNNPYFHELKGQALLEAARPAEAIAPLRRAAALAPNAALIRIMLGKALVATGEKRHAEEAIALLRVAMQREPDAPEVYSQLAMAYGRKGDYAEADLASAQAALARGDMKTARELAARAKPVSRPDRPAGSAPTTSSASSGPDRPAREPTSRSARRKGRPTLSRSRTNPMIRFAPLLAAATIALRGARRRPSRSRSRSARRSARSSRNT